MTQKYFHINKVQLPEIIKLKDSAKAFGESSENLYQQLLSMINYNRSMVTVLEEKRETSRVKMPDDTVVIMRNSYLKPKPPKNYMKGEI
tara:strand:- start:417 stop:683 length:267 start_codon:yes stop_codon:yes gene_type:complete